MSGPHLDVIREACKRVRDEASLSSIISRSLKLKKASREWSACCPFHADRTPSFTIYANDRRFMCFGCGAEGDAIDWVRRFYGVSLIDAIELIASQALPASGTVRNDNIKPEQNADRSAEALDIWAASLPPEGTPAEAYLRSRRLILPIPASIRFARIPLGRRPIMPALVALVTGPDDQPCGIQRTFLTEAGHKANLPGGRVKLSLGRVRGGAIRLAPATHGLFIVEGLEDGLTLMQQLGRPAWIAAGSGMLPAMRLPHHLSGVVIGADSDNAGRAAAERAELAFKAQGVAAATIFPAEGFKDFNGELLGAQV
ncbi:CHC2 zinc finger domain-containing protein [Sphingomonas solaris]|uniref:Virulence-associated protein E n=1 Tax=Alterirhizorhabdus solaris TaxID=2529389 RepID=A0A558R9G6_9SPHN|nr:CHC2 zinc finger domain-containing protein [Sphingomonas solaris]TVV76029.1 virulence-associated protein E [Sphingomonas solaris]